MSEDGVEIKSFQRTVHALAVGRGWWDDEDVSRPNDIAAKIALIHGELSEALECLRDGDIHLRLDPDSGKPEGFVVELADAIIRTLDLCEAMNLDVASAMVRKHEYNTTRPYRHGGKAL